MGEATLRNLSPELLAQLYGQDSSDPFLMLLTLTHPSFPAPFRLVNNTTDVVSRGNTFTAYPFNFTLPVDDGETLREVSLTMDNISQEIITELRQISSPISILIEMVVASAPDTVQIELAGLEMKNIQYTATRINAKVFMDDFLSTELTSEKYTPSTFPGIF